MRIYVVLFSLMLTTLAFGQEKDQEQLNREAREHVREGNKLYNELKFSEAEVEYKKALSKNPLYEKAAYNLGNTVYNQDRNKEAVGQYQLVEKSATEKMSKAEVFHNKGNAFMNEKQYAQAIDAYKNSLRNNSKDDETRYNLALAQELLEDQQNQQNQNQQNKDDKNENKDKKQDKDQKEKEGGDEEREQDKQEDKEQGENKEDDNAKDKKNEKQDQDKKQQQQNPSQLTPEQMKQLLEAMNNEENKTQKKLNAQKAKGKKVKQEKDW